VVNTTPVGMAMKPGSPLPVEWLLPGQFVYDTVYTPAETELIVAARARGCRTRNGIGMLTRQGAKAFHLWTGIEPDADAMETTLREQLAG
jgi:shikimate dehydrogenase